MKRWLFLAFIGTASAAFAAQEVELGCKHLRIVLDARLNPDTVEREWASGISRTEAPAALELVGCAGQLLDQFILAAPLAKIDPVPVRGTRNPTYLVSADLTVEAGSYNGPLTVPVEVVGDHLVAAVARFADQREEPIHLTLTGKSAWKRVSRRNAEDLFLVSCQPKGRGFVTSYRRYSPSHQAWKVKVRTRNVLWESDGDFPRRQFFP